MRARRPHTYLLLYLNVSALGTANLCSHHGKQDGGFSKNLKTEMPYDPSGCIFKKLKTLFEKIHAPSVCYSIIYNSQDMEAT